MKRKTDPIADNVFADLGFSPAEAKAASLIGVSRPRVSDVIRYKNSNFTVDALIDMVVRTGQPLQITL